MAGVVTTGSETIALLDIKVVASLCSGKICVDTTPSIYIADGEGEVLGANVQITNPSGVIVKPFGSNYEIAPALSGGMDAPICFNIPTIAGNYQYGKYKVEVDLYDDEGTKFTITKYVTICEPDKKNVSRNYGSVSALLKGICKDGKMNVVVDAVPTYRGTVAQSQDNDFKLLYPTESELPPIENIELTNFAVLLFQGEYKLTGEICALYNFSDNVYVEVKYKVKKSKIVRCIIDYCCIYTKLEELHLKSKSDCSETEKNNTASIVLSALSLVKTIELAAECGQDGSSYVEDLEDLLGCRCTCNCDPGTPVINTTQSPTVLIEGCNVEKTTVGLTDSYVIDNYEYKVDVVENGGVFVIATAVLANCVKTQMITFNVSTLYSQIKTLANQNVIEADAWAVVINKALRDVNPSCLGLTLVAWNALTFKEKFTALATKVCNCCGSCDATVEVDSIVKDGADVVLTWSATNATYLEFYLDGVLKGTILVATAPNDFVFENAANGIEHTYLIIPKCSDNSAGTSITDEFIFTGCPDIPKPTVTDAYAENVECPFDLTSLNSSPGVGYEYQWRTSNSTANDSNLVANPEGVVAGIYWLFAKSTTDGCYSQGTQVIVTCAEDSCSAPQNPSVETVVGFATVNTISFYSAAYPPPSNSYTVKRRKSSDPDVPGSYTTIGTPVWNVSLGKWQISDVTALNNTLYVYRIQSNCGGSPEATPYVDIEYVYITCPEMTFTPGDTTIDYSFPPVGGEVSQYLVKIFDGNTLVHTDTYVPSFSNPTTGTFNYLESGKTYRIEVWVYVTDYAKQCDWEEVTTTAP